MTLFRRSERLASWISQLPSNWLRIQCYRLVFGYQISPQAKLGRGTILAATEVQIGRARLGCNNRILGPFRFTMEDDATLGDRNQIICGPWVLAAKFQTPEYRRECTLAASSLVTHEHFIDTVGGFHLGTRAYLAGRGTQVWTHGLGPGEVRIGDGAYIGSAARFAPGSSIGEKCIVGMGSVVTKAFPETRVMIAGVPARVIREIDPSEEALVQPN